nr:NUDIX domain-containing protein [uncultured Holophaga sp.]
MRPTPRPARQPSTEEQDFLSAYDPSAFERPSVTVDLVILAPAGDSLVTLLIRRPEHPFRGLWSLPGGFVRMDESLDEAAARVLRGKTGLDCGYLEQLYTFGNPGRDPRTRVISVAYVALLDPLRFRDIPQSGGDVMVARVTPPPDAPLAISLADPTGQKLELAFDHAEILDTSLRRLRGKIDYTPIGFELLPPTFTLLQLQKIHELVLGRKLNKDSFRRRMLALGQLEATGELQQEVDHRPAALYRYVPIA